MQPAPSVAPVVGPPLLDTGPAGSAVEVEEPTKPVPQISTSFPAPPQTSTGFPTPPQTPTSFPAQTPTSFPAQTPTSFPAQTPTSFPAPPPHPVPGIPPPAAAGGVTYTSLPDPRRSGASDMVPEQREPEPRPGRHTVPEELVQAATYVLPPDRIARAKVVRRPDGPAEPPVPRPRGT